MAVVLQTAAGTGLRIFGHYWSASTTYGNHLKETADHTNVQWAEDVAGLRLCASNGARCILQVRWEFFSGGGADGRTPNPILPDHAARWGRTATQIAPLAGHIEAFYVIDEPYWNGVSPADLATCIAAVKGSFPDKPVIVIFAVPSLTEKLVVPERADWVGFDCYEDIGAVSKHLRFLKGKLHAHQRLVLVPQSFLNAAAPTDEALAGLTRRYDDLARSEPRVIGQLAYGLFTEKSATNLPLTRAAQREIGQRIIRPALPEAGKP